MRFNKVIINHLKKITFLKMYDFLLCSALPIISVLLESKWEKFSISTGISIMRMSALLDARSKLLLGRLFMRWLEQNSRKV